METISVPITDTFNMLCFQSLYLINIFTKPAKTEGCTDTTFKMAFYCLFVTIEDVNL